MRSACAVAWTRGASVVHASARATVERARVEATHSRWDTAASASVSRGSGRPASSNGRSSGRSSARAMSSESSDASSSEDAAKRAKKAAKRAKKAGAAYPETRSVEAGGERYRRCACAVVFNDRGEILVGERSDRPGSWNMPQGGIEKNESVEAAAARELFEETGVRAKSGANDDDGVVELVGALPEDNGYCYRVDGPSWLSERGLVGQRLEFCLFRWRARDAADARALEDPSSHPAVNLSGLDGEPREFSRLRWMSFDDVVEGVWPSKRGPYALARDVARPRVARALADSP